MKVPPNITSLVLALLTLCPLLAQSQPKDAFAQNQRLGRGVNIIGYDPLWKSQDQARFQAKHFRLLKEAGFDSVRINLHAFRAMGRTNPWALNPSWLATLDWAVQNATNAGLVAILDFHEYNTMAENPEANHEKFLAFWRQLSDHCRGASDQVFFEILNEPAKKLTPALWNQYLKEALALIREKNPARTVIIGPAFWNSIDHLAELELPREDRNLIVTVHYYKPMEFTHQGAAWSTHKDKRDVAWTGTDAQRQAVKDDFAKAVAWAKAQDRPLFLGEFGAYDQAPMESRVCYTDAVARTAEALGWSWAYWQFDKDFILYDIPRDAWVEPIRNALVPLVRIPAVPNYRGQPFEGRVQSIPGRLECARFDAGPEGVAYHDTDASNNGSGVLNQQKNHQRPHATPYHWNFRTNSGVDVSYTKDFADFNHNQNLVNPPTNQFYLGWMEDGEWCNYTVNVQQAGTYKITALYGHEANTFMLAINNQPASECKLPVATGSFHKWNQAAVGAITFAEPGLHLLTLHYNKGNNFAWFDFARQP